MILMQVFSLLDIDFHNYTFTKKLLIIIGLSSDDYFNGRDIVFKGYHHGYYPLELAIGQEDYQMVKLLLDHGAKPAQMVSSDHSNNISFIFDYIH